ncbi:MAG: redoxin domain-containing protein [Planctomycetaceae bacterium]|nr:redoxin domain-containing protein [Planctomycetaceae bacterium]
MKTFLKPVCLVASVVLAVVSLTSPQVYAEDIELPEPGGHAELLTIGSKAPALDIENWVSDGNGQYKEVTQFEAGKVYVVEFWATWCGPCIASMPHLSKMQDDYAKRGVQIVSVSDEDLETVEKFLSGEVRGGKPGQTYAQLTSNYSLTCDADKSVSQDYMVAAGRNGIPCAFVVGKTGLIEWIGHPMSMEETLAQVVDGSWNREVFAATFKEGQLYESVIEPQTMAAFRQGNFDKAVEILDKALQTLTDEELIARAVFMRRSIILLGGGEKGVKEVASYLEKNKNDNDQLNRLGSWIYSMAARKQIDKDVVKAGIELAMQSNKNDPTSFNALQILSHLYQIDGNVDQAIVSQKKAVAIFVAKKEDVPQGITAFLDELLAEKKEQVTKNVETDSKPKS